MLGLLYIYVICSYFSLFFQLSRGTLSKKLATQAVSGQSGEVFNRSYGGMKRYKNFGILGAITLIPSKPLYQNQQYVVPRISVLIERLCMFGQIHGRLSPISCTIIIIIIIYLLVFKKGRINNSLKCYLCIIFKGNRVNTKGKLKYFVGVSLRVGRLWFALQGTE